jgi:hypothetical protein
MRKKDFSKISNYEDGFLSKLDDSEGGDPQTLEGSQPLIVSVRTACRQNQHDAFSQSEG